MDRCPAHFVSRQGRLCEHRNKRTPQAWKKHILGSEVSIPLMTARAMKSPSIFLSFLSPRIALPIINKSEPSLLAENTFTIEWYRDSTNSQAFFRESLISAQGNR